MLKFINPYPGFYNGFHRSYEYDESDLFFGRENDLKNLKIRFRKDKFISVLSLPKAGKTSFLKAGLIPDLERSNFSGIHGSKWTSVYFTPGTDPILNLARAIANPQSYSIQKIKPTKEEEVINKLNKNDYGLIRVSEDLISNKESNILYIIDDFMDVFKPAIDERKQAAFKQLLVKAAKAKGTAIYVMAVFNEEDINNIYLNSHKDLMKLIRQNSYKLRFLDQMSLRDAIMEPAKLEKSEVNDKLLYKLIEELLTDQDQLRKLQIYMHRSWFEWKKNHKDKYINLQHFQKASGQRTRTKIKTRLGGASKSDKTEVVEEISQDAGMVDLGSENIALAGIIGDYNNLNDQNRLLFSQLIPLLVRKDDNDIYISQPVEFSDAAEILGTKDSDLIRMINTASATFGIDKKQLKIVDADLITEWEVSRAWLEGEQANISKYKKLADASIMHYIEGIEISDLIDETEYSEIKTWFDDFNPSEAWAKLHHTQYELAVDLIGKMVELYGPVSKSKKKPATSTPKKKISLKIKSTDEEKGKQPAELKEEVESKLNEEQIEESETLEVEGMDEEDKAIAALLAGDSEKKEVPKKVLAKTSQATSKKPQKTEQPKEEVMEEKVEITSKEEKISKPPEQKPAKKPPTTPRKKINLKKDKGPAPSEIKNEVEKKLPRKKVVIKKRK